MTQPKDPVVGFNFVVDLQGGATGYFTEVSGLGSETEVAEHKVISKDGKIGIVQQLPGRLKWESIVLKRGITADMDMWDWRQQVEEGKVEAARKNGTITMLANDYTPVAKWDFVRAWPSKMSGPSISSKSTDVSIEEMTLVHEGIKRVKI